ncbi:MAG: sterol desaturase family protein [Gammaproteobacteria bacterium]|nr:sterol desaturase family protein [Gammaproteobacteria bacterium]
MEGEFNALRSGMFAGILLLMLVIERVWPKRRQIVPTWPRLSTNLGLIVIDTLLVRLLLPLTVVGTAVWAAQQSWGLFNQVQLPPALELVAALLILDLAIYLQHRAAHHFTWFWRIHRVHHADPRFDTTTGIRFHPLEIIISTVYKMLLVVLLGPSAIAVLIFEIVLNGTSLFTHTNVALPRKLDAVLRLLIVTPDVHRVHHSHLSPETNSNFGFNLTVWDRLFHTWKEQPDRGHAAMDIGLPEYAGDRPTHLGWCLWLPFTK